MVRVSGKSGGGRLGAHQLIQGLRVGSGAGGWVCSWPDVWHAAYLICAYVVLCLFCRESSCCLCSCFGSRGFKSILNGP